MSRHFAGCFDGVFANMTSQLLAETRLAASVRSCWNDAYYGDGAASTNTVEPTQDSDPYRK